jgi:hypothetical protein
MTSPSNGTTYGPSSTPPTGAGSYSVVGTISNANYQGTASGTLVIGKATPVITWHPASLELGFSLGSAQLDATANFAGTSFVYTPPSGTPVVTTTELLSVIFTPTNTSDYNTASLSVPLTVTPGPLVSLSPASLPFGTVYLGSLTTRNVTVSNTGNAPLTITDPFISIVQGGDSSEFIALSLCPRSLAAGKSCTISIIFVAGPFYNPETATLSIMDNAGGSPQTVALTALVIDPQAQLSAANLNFGTKKKGTSSTAMPVTLTNTGATALTIDSIAIAGKDPLDFTQTNNCPASLKMKSSCTIDVTFKPTATGSRTGSVVITDNAQNSSQSISLSGTGN